MRRLTALYSTTLGKKAVVAVTGILFYGFVLLHMLGNLKVFTGNVATGEPHIDVYAAFLRTMGEPLVPHGFILWCVRIVLLIALILHVVTVLQLAARNRRARDTRYAHHQYNESSVPARLMLVSGFLLLAFLVFHLLQFTFGVIGVTRFEQEEVYSNLYYAFQTWFFVLIYVVAMAALALHVNHGIWSLFQTLGLDNPDRNRAFRILATASAIVLFVGFSSVPVLFFLGEMPPPPTAEMAAHLSGGGK